MNRTVAKEFAKGQLANYLSAKGININKPFICLNPDHNDTHPSASYYKKSNYVKCFSCNACYDIFDLVGIDYGLTNDLDIFNKTYEILNLDIDTRQTAAADFSDGEKINNIPQATPVQQVIDDLEEIETFDFTNIVNDCHEELLTNIDALDYLQTKRGLSMDIITLYKLGYCDKGYNAVVADHPGSLSKSYKADLYKYTIPYTALDDKNNYILFEISDRNEIDTYNAKYKKITGLKAPIFNERYLQQDAPPEVIFICEGIYDALSVEDVGGKSIAFVGTADKRFLKLCKKYSPDTTFIIGLDNDNAGQSAINRVKEGLDSLNMRYIVGTAAGGKDFNEEYTTDKSSFKAHIERLQCEAREIYENEKNALYEAYTQRSNINYITDLLRQINGKSKTKCYSTGFRYIDKILDGGFYAGLYILGAISSLGKTTFSIQLADNIAKSGEDVIIISLEMARNELMAKSISRHTAIESQRLHKNSQYAKTTRDILTGRIGSDEGQAVVNSAINSYTGYSDHIYIYEGVGDIGVTDIADIVKQHINITGNKPVVFIDYLQILAPYSDRASDKQNTDKAVLELKRITRDYNIPIVAISSFNRDNYYEPVSMASFKESGAIEYGSDVLIGLQYRGMDIVKGETEKDRKKRVIELNENIKALNKRGYDVKIQVKILKNRNGYREDAYLCMVSKYNLFFEPESQEEARNGFAYLTPEEEKELIENPGKRI